MATKQDIIDAVHETLVEALTDVTDTPESELYDNVRLAQRAGKSPLPAYTIEVFETPVERGLGSSVHTADVSRVGDHIEVTTFREKDATIDIAAHAADDDARRMNELYDAAEAGFEPFTNDPESLHDDVTRVQLQGTQDISSPQDAIRGDRLRVEIRYDRYFERDFMTPMEHIDVDVNVGPTDKSADEVDDHGTVSVTYNTNDG